ncbi:MAG TPA: hypothetical protein VGH46_07585 [Gaiellaceae bacterium]|jgi:hypothetical protein
MVPNGRALRRRVRKSHLAPREKLDQAGGVAEPSDSEALDAILISCQYAHVKLGRILDFLEDYGEEEEDEADG